MNSLGTVTIDTERLLLRRFEYSDAKDMLELWVSKPEIQYPYSEPIYTTLEEVNNLLKSIYHHTKMITITGGQLLM